MRSSIGRRIRQAREAYGSRECETRREPHLIIKTGEDVLAALLSRNTHTAHRRKEKIRALRVEMDEERRGISGEISR